MVVELIFQLHLAVKKYVHVIRATYKTVFHSAQPHEQVGPWFRAVCPLTDARVLSLIQDFRHLLVP